MKYYIPLIIIVSLFCFISAATCDPTVLKASIDGVGQILGAGADLAGALGAPPEVAEGLGIVSDVTRGATARVSGTEYDNRYGRQVAPGSNEPIKYTITFTNNTDFFVSIIGYGESITIPPRGNFSGPTRHSIQTEEQHRKGWDYTLVYDDNKITWTPEGDRNVTFRDRKEFHGSYKDEETDLTEKTESNIPVNTFEIVENGLEKQSPEILADIPTPDFDQNAPGFDTIPDAKTAVNPQTDYTNHVPLGDPVRIANNVPQQSHDPLPLISNFRKGMYYVQIGSYTNENTVYTEIAKIDNSLPVAVMRATVKINGINKEVHRVLIGPLDYENSLLLLQQFRVNYHDAFVWHGR